MFGFGYSGVGLPYIYPEKLYKHNNTQTGSNLIITVKYVNHLSELG